MSPSPLPPRAPLSSLDLDLIAQRILTLAEVATLEHLQLLLNSQAASMLHLAPDTDSA